MRIYCKSTIAAGSLVAGPVALYVRFVENPGLPVMAFLHVAAFAIILAALIWRRNPGFGLVLVGMGLNMLVILSNGGRMPVVAYDGQLGTLWQTATNDTHLAFLADQPYLGYASLGDVLFAIGIVTAVMFAVRGRIGNRRTPSGPTLKTNRISA